MTNPTEPVLAVEQVDREAAIANMLRIGRINEINAEAIRRREWDHTDDVIDWSRHRLTATATLQAEIAAKDARIAELEAALDAERRLASVLQAHMNIAILERDEAREQFDNHVVWASGELKKLEDAARQTLRGQP